MNATLKGLLVFFENYYGEKYSGMLLDAMTSYLDGYSDNFYHASATVMIRRFSRIYNKVPGPAEFEKHLPEILAAMPKPELLPEVKREITDEERSESIKLLNEIKNLFKSNAQSDNNVKYKPTNHISSGFMKVINQMGSQEE